MVPTFRGRKRLWELRWHRGIPRLVLHERHQRASKWILRVLAAIGLVTCVVRLRWYYSLALGVTLLLVEQLLERVVFRYSTMLIWPLGLDVDLNRWGGMAYGVVDPESDSPARFVGLVFNDRDVAARFFGLLRSWNDDSAVDTAGNIKLTFVFDEDRYFVYLYPRPDHDSVGAFFAAMEERYKVDKFGKEHARLVQMRIICKEFPLGEYAVGTFVDGQQADRPFVLAAFSEDLRPIVEIAPIEMTEFKSRAVVDLDENDLELVHWRYVINK